ncbi:MAG: tRNA (adenosine(37)-N6)-threonylcarbamoyltransferase complex transferase subunit TsaD, partial [Rhodospirillaceae bacterium]|jgi:N6-L-threonylcarbamoyladenine synthase|nr:tRNA (adenosine(37)-N6)-threonylcarbamoyltransferase complex transferase subunit TsaD [Rhodospirillaceae bacterium]MBT4937796.1 tRNA (adenosine(37)-N6)-threonylcarbamoyltransferase complex transferase subunit TsaD [Rhodospirillaceae bacterium]MBT7266179.1 tRNA (adenosine(37)-N6)-threonylcarbamoyltransferase complex transferase subunit TsaD [Rhodospirillaceae bacterium]
MLILGIESSCDETAAAIVTDDARPDQRIVSNVVLSQEEEHRPYGGIVPEIAARSHLEHIDTLIEQAMKTANVSFADLDGIAATGGPGLIGGVIVGVMSAKAIASVQKKPFIAVNHLEGHALTARLTSNVAFPYLLLLVSGGHCQLLIVEGVGRYKRLGTTVDDALGEAFDKCAKMMGLGYPGGPIVEAAAKQGDGTRFDLPRPMVGRQECHFSFSGLKTAIRRQIVQLGDEAMTDQDVADLCASFQAAAGDVLIDRCQNALQQFRAIHPGGDTLVVAGGVAANQTLGARLADLEASENITLVVPPPALCTDNAAMIAWAGLEQLKAGHIDPLDFKPRPRWPLDPDAPAAIGAGVKA